MFRKKYSAYHTLEHITGGTKWRLSIFMFRKKYGAYHTLEHITGGTKWLKLFIIENK